MLLHHAWRSSASRRVRLCLEEKGLRYETREVDMANMEHHSPAYLAINPNGVVPTLVLDDGRALHESGTICEYLDEVYPEPPLRPADPYQRAEMRNWIRHIDERIGNLIVFNWAHHLQKTAQQWTDEELAEKLKRIPGKARQEAWRRVARRPYTDEERAEARANLTRLLDRMDATLGATGWLAGGSYTIADRGRAVREAHRGRDRPGRGHRGEAPGRARLVDEDPSAPGVRARADRPVPGLVESL